MEQIIMRINQNIITNWNNDNFVFSNNEKNIIYFHICNFDLKLKNKIYFCNKKFIEKTLTNINMDDFVRIKEYMNINDCLFSGYIENEFLKKMFKYSKYINDFIPYFLDKFIDANKHKQYWINEKILKNEFLTAETFKILQFYF